jgi:hypothetical protein
MEKNLEGTIWENYEIPSFGEFLKQLDARLMVEIENDPAGVWKPLFDFFDSDPDNPLTPREFLEYWNSLTEEDRLFTMLELG